MYNVLLVEDEAVIRQAFEALVDWESTGFSVVAVASNGLEALNILNSTAIDLVVTDIRMPQMDGITLAGRIRAEYAEVAVILLSAYSEFSYAQQAIKHGVFGYVLKSDEPAKIEQQLHALRQQLDRSRERAALAREDNERLLWQYREALAESWAQGKDDEGLYQHAAFPPVGGAWTLAEAISFEQQRMMQTYGAQVMFSIGMRVREILEAVLGQSGFLFPYLQRLFVVTNEPDKLALALEKLLDEPWEMENDAFSIVYHPQAFTRDTLAQGFRAMLPTDQDWFRLQSGCVCEAFEPVKAATMPRDTLLQELADQLVAALSRKDESALQKVIRSLEAQGNLRSLRSMQEVQFLLRDVLRLASRNTALKDALDQLMEETAQCATVNGVLHLLGDRLNDILNMETEDAGSTRRVMLAAAQYLEQHFAENLSLQSMADRFSMSPGYFSKLFVKEIGCNYIERLTALRIDCAKRLLRETNDRIYEIAGRVGYRKTRHFSEIFRKNAGVTPVEYRELHQRTV